MASQSKVYFFFDNVSYSLKQRAALKLHIEQIFSTKKRSLLRLNYVFCSDKTLLKINRDYLKHDYYTDIITFDLSEKHQAIEAEVYISLDRVRDNARSQGVTFGSELHRVLFHGALHLCGFKDKTDKEKNRMRTEEDRLLASWNKKRAHL